MKILIFILLEFALGWKLIVAQQWKSIGPPGGRVSALSISPSDPKTIFAATRENVLFISHDGGITSEVIHDFSYPQYLLVKT